MQAERLENIVLVAHHWEAHDFTPQEVKLLAGWLGVSRAQFPRRWAAVQGVSQHLHPGQRGEVQTYLRSGNVCTIAQAAGFGKLCPGEAEAEIITLYNRLIIGWQRWQRDQEPPPVQQPAPVQQLSLF